jgi:hypothetical protein
VERARGAGKVATLVVAEIALIPISLALIPFTMLDERYGWTSSGRRRRAAAALWRGHAVSLDAAEGVGRAVVEGRLVSSGPRVRVPFVDQDALAWCAWGFNGSAVHFVDGAVARLELVSTSGRAPLDAIDPRGVPRGLGAHAPVREVPAEWIDRARRWAVDEWVVTWVPDDTPARVSGKVTVLEGDGYREAARGWRIGPSDDGVPVLLGEVRRARTDPL